MRTHAVSSGAPARTFGRAGRVAAPAARCSVSSAAARGSDSNVSSSSAASTSSRGAGSVSDRREPNARPLAARVAAAAAAAAAIVLLPGGGGAALAGASSDFELPYAAPEITRDSSPRALQLAARLRDAGAQMFGAFWCSHCFEMEQAFGKQAVGTFPYVECFPEGWRRGVQLAPACAAVPVQAFPTWVIGSQVIEGELDFDTLSALLDEAAKAPAAAS